MTVCYCQILCMCFNDFFFFTEWEEVIECAFKKYKCVDALDHLDIIKTCDQVIRW